MDPTASVTDYGNGLGLLINRELGRPSNWLDRPNCDIAFSEMTNLLRNHEGGRLGIRTLTTGYLKVEILPLITTSVK